MHVWNSKGTVTVSVDVTEIAESVIWFRIKHCSFLCFYAFLFCWYLITMHALCGCIFLCCWTYCAVTLGFCYCSVMPQLASLLWCNDPFNQSYSLLMLHCYQWTVNNKCNWLSIFLNNVRVLLAHPVVASRLSLGRSTEDTESILPWHLVCGVVMSLNMEVLFSIGQLTVL